MEILNGIAFNSQPKAYWIHRQLRQTVRLRLTVKLDQASTCDKTYRWKLAMLARV